MKSFTFALGIFVLLLSFVDTFGYLMHAGKERIIRENRQEKSTIPDHPISGAPWEQGF